MSVVFVLVLVAIVMAFAFLMAFIWAVKNGQYEDTYTPSVRILFEDPPVKEAESRSDQSQLAEPEKRKPETGEGESRSVQSH
ncbi:MAG: cbb3-type cytochrome oxidase assembly protein CcoS [Bacteroidota bacterium]|nr:cbb3-type cytochrome oxidase assembly protein CcoS [Odoribacter sp.]MDP3644518.1 cbb3-type cytochrome oxidase assembly protein CcoS [Bacteroidota bacterium]